MVRCHGAHGPFAAYGEPRDERGGRRAAAKAPHDRSPEAAGSLTETAEDVFGRIAAEPEARHRHSSIERQLK